MSKLPQVTHSQHERTVEIIRCQTEHIGQKPLLTLGVSISSRPIYVLTHHVDIKCYTCVVASRDCKTGSLCPKADFRFWQVQTLF